MRVALIFIFCASAYGALSPAMQSAEYYYSRSDYKQAFQLWSAAYPEVQDQLFPTLRMAELKLLIEGRAPSRDILRDFLVKRQDAYDSETHKQIRMKWESTAKAFLTDEGQSFYLQAQVKAKAEEWEMALGLLQSAESQEKGNTLILERKAEMERRLKYFDRALGSLEVAFQFYPFSPSIRDALYEGYVHSYQTPKILATLKPLRLGSFSARQRLAIGYALLDSRALSEAISFLEPLATKEKNPLAYYGLGKAYSQRQEKPLLAKYYFDRFLATAPKYCASLDFDPYRCTDKLEEVTKARAVGTN